MSSKSKSRKYVKNPYGNKSKRGRGGALIVTVVILVMAAGTWITSYTANIGESVTESAAQSSKAETKN